MYVLIAFISLWVGRTHTEPVSIYTEKFLTKTQCEDFRKKLDTEFGNRLRESRCIIRN